MPKNNDMGMSDKVQADYDMVCKQADRLGLKGQTREEYIYKHMTGFGYKPRTTYVEDRSKDESNGGGFFGSGYRDDED